MIEIDRLLLVFKNWTSHRPDQSIESIDHWSNECVTHWTTNWFVL